MILRTKANSAAELLRGYGSSGAFTPSYGYVGEYEQPVAEKAADESRQWMQRVIARACVVSTARPVS